MTESTALIYMKAYITQFYPSINKIHSVGGGGKGFFLDRVIFELVMDSISPLQLNN